MRASAAADYEWQFDGRFMFAPALVRRGEDAIPGGASVVSAFGWTLGGFVALEYDSSPVGAYYEVVEMGALVAKGGLLGQWGRELCVSTRPAEKVCRDAWGVPARLSRITFSEAPSGEKRLALRARADGGFGLEGWSATRSSEATTDPSEPRALGLPVLWTPTIKALWAPIALDLLGALAALFAPATDEKLALHKLRLSATSLALSSFELQDDRRAPREIIPFGFALSADGVRIEIAPARKTL